jgi:hypothetical protein
MNEWNTRVNEIFLSALEKATVRQAYLDTVCGDDTELRRAVEDMLSAHEKAGSFLDQGLPQTLIATKSPTPPEVFGRYRLKGVLGQGGMGRVYVAFDTILERDVALKVPHASEVADPVAVKRFYREARVAAGFTDPHLCPVYDVGEIDGVHYLTMPLLRGETLAARVQREGRLPQMAAARIAMAVARGLQVAHQAGILHRDLKPANILLDEAGSPIVMDFGLARRADTSDRLTKSGMTAGTPAYLAPEQIGGGEDLGPATDVYSLGVILYEMLAGRLPLEGTSSEILRRRLMEDPLPPAHFCHELDSRLNSICMIALAREPGRRFASMDALAGVLAHVLGEGPTEECIPLLEQMQRRQRSHRWRYVVLALFSTGLIAALICLAMMLKGGTGKTKQEEAPVPLITLSAGSVWKGEFHFVPQGTKDGDLVVRITQRNGERFEGFYSAENGSYEWRIAGTLDGTSIHWGFTEALKGENAEQLVGKGIVDGTLKDATILGKFDDSADNSHAEIKITRQ